MYSSIKDKEKKRAQDPDDGMGIEDGGVSQNKRRRKNRMRVDENVWKI